MTDKDRRRDGDAFGRWTEEVALMPDPVLMLTAMAIAFVVSAVLLGVIGWQTRQVGSSAFDIGWILGVAAGFTLGCWVLGSRPHWPPRDDQERLLALILPAVAVVELLAAFPKVPRWLIWPLRLMIVAGGARVLLHGTTYITDLTGPGTSEWSPSLAGQIFAGSAALEAAVWVLLCLLACRAPGPWLPVCLAGTTAGTAVTVMLSGYATGGQVGLPLAAALMGATSAALVLNRKSPRTGPLGVAIVGLFSLLVMGRFFGELTSVHAVVLFCAPLLGWLPELPYARRLPPWARGLARVILVGTVVLAVIISAQRKFSHDFAPPGARARRSLPFRITWTSVNRAGKRTRRARLFRKTGSPLARIRRHFYNCPMSDNCQRS